MIVIWVGIGVGVGVGVGILTVKVVEPLTPRVALMVEVPAFTPMAKPELEIVATDGIADAHVTRLVRFCVDVLEYVPVAANC